MVGWIHAWAWQEGLVLDFCHLLLFPLSIDSRYPRLTSYTDGIIRSYIPIRKPKISSNPTVLACSLPPARLSCSSNRNMQPHTLTDMPDNQHHSFQQPTSRGQTTTTSEKSLPLTPAVFPFPGARAHHPSSQRERSAFRGLYPCSRPKGEMSANSAQLQTSQRPRVGD